MASTSSPFSRQVTNLNLFSRTYPPSFSPHSLHLHQNQRLSLSPISTVVHLPDNSCQPHRTSLSCGLAVAIPNYSSHRIIHRNHVLGSVLSAQTRIAKVHGGLNLEAAGPTTTKSHCLDWDGLPIRQRFSNSGETMQTHLASVIKSHNKCWPHLSERPVDTKQGELKGHLTAGPVCSEYHGRAEGPVQPRNNVMPSLSGQRQSIGVAGPNFREKLRRFLAVKNGHISGLEDRIQTLERKNGETLLGVRRFKRKYSQIKRQLRREVFRLKLERSFILLILLFL